MKHQIRQIFRREVDAAMYGEFISQTSFEVNDRLRKGLYLALLQELKIHRDQAYYETWNQIMGFSLR